MTRHILLLLITLLFASEAVAQRSKKIKDFHYTYRCGAESCTLKEAIQHAIESAQAEAIATTFGKDVTSETNQVLHDGSRSFSAVSTTRIHGTWVKDTRKPDIDVSQSTSDLYVINVTLNGEIKKRDKSPNDWFVAKLLRGHTDDRYESNTFISGDTCYISIRATCNGYVAVYLLPCDERAYCLVPSPWQREANTKITANKRHVLLNEEDYSISFECANGRKEEINEMYVIFSPNKFSRPIDNDDDQSAGFTQPRWLSEQSFRQWIQKLQADDEDACVKHSTIRISKQ